MSSFASVACRRDIAILFDAEQRPLYRSEVYGKLEGRHPRRVVEDTLHSLVSDAPFYVAGM